ncbi:MAG: DUF1501 domain-containing protein [Planctomycetaceae bacterium]|nr:DUF1501 domain-containing protein [Planctomycetaceae bacterium]
MGPGRRVRGSRSMFGIGNYSARDCQGVTRRSFLQIGAGLPFAAGLLGGPQSARGAEGPKARSVMLIWLMGGPSHLDLFDPKPNAPAEYRGPFAAIPTRTIGMAFSELLPRLAARSDRFSVVRTNINYDGGHRPAGSIAWTCGKAGDGGESGNGKPSGYPPHVGSIVARSRGQGELPGFISLARGPVGDGVGPCLGFGGGVWGQRFDPFMVDCAKNGQISIPELKLLDGLSPVRLTDRRALLSQLGETRRRLDEVRLEQWDGLHQKAFQLLRGAATLDAFDMSRETAATRARYGRTSFGQSCLLGRRLVEAGVPYVQVNWSQFAEVLYPFSDYGWDTHADNFGLLADWHGPLLDQAFSTLLDDLRDRGLLETTLVVCMGEFGRTPRINSIGSRDHWHQCYFSVWAGGGVQPGRAIGESDPVGEHPKTAPITPEMVGTTIVELAGVSSQQRAEFRVLEGGRVIHDLL